jgi:ATP-binding cassette subfamily B protein
VVGMNGSGKTTMIKLLTRLYDPSEGTITLNGIDIKKYDYDEYIRIFAVVFQDFKLPALPLGQNVAAGFDYDPDRVHRALVETGFGTRPGERESGHEGGRLAELPRGLDTPLYKDYDEEGVSISGGEAQKIALARAIYRDAPFVILDEPTAALDPLAEYEIYSHFDSIVGGKTAVYISHRLSSCRFCHNIAVFHEGRLVQQGSHETLVAEEGGKYVELWNAQAQHYV